MYVIVCYTYEAIACLSLFTICIYPSTIDANTAFLSSCINHQKDNVVFFALKYVFRFKSNLDYIVILKY